MVNTGPAILQTCLKFLAEFTLLFLSSPAHVQIDKNLSFNLQAVRSTARLDSAFIWFPGNVISEWVLRFMDLSELPMQLFVKVHSSF